MTVRNCLCGIVRDVLCEFCMGKKEEKKEEKKTSDAPIEDTQENK